MTTVLCLAVVVATAVLGRLHVAGRRALARERAGLFDDVWDLFEQPRLHQDGIGYPTLTGRLDGYRTTIRPVIDSLTLRKLPVLWLEFTQHRRLPVQSSLSVLLRPQGTEFFSPNGGFAREVAAPEPFPRPVRVASPDPDRAPPPALLVPIVDYLNEPATKEVGLGARGTRAVRLLAEGDQGSYRTTRRAAFDRLRVSRAEVVRTVTVLGDVGDLVAPATTGRS